MRALRPLRLLLPLALALGCQGVDPTPEAPELTPERREYFVRRRLEDARAFRAQERLPAAERQLRTALRVAPEHPEGLRLLALVLEESGRADEAAPLWDRADAVDPPPDPIPTTRLVAPSEGVLVALVPPDSADGAGRLPQGWPDAGLADALRAHLERRLPGAAIERADPRNVAAARAWLRAREPRVVVSLRVDRAVCGDSAKDGPFALVRLRAALAREDEVVLAPTAIRSGELELRHREACPQRPLLRAVEQLLALPAVQRALLEPGAPGAWPSAAVRPLFPAIGHRLAEEIESGRRLLALGRVREAGQTLERAAAIDPEDPDLRAYLAEAQQTLAMARELQARQGDPPPDADPGVLDPQLTAAQRDVAERLLAREREARDQMLAALTLFDHDDATLPPPETFEALRPRPPRSPDATGPRLARQKAGGAVEARSLYAPSGAVLATYYFPSGKSVPVLYEQDTGDDGRPDRWTFYDRNTRRELWEDGGGTGHPDVHIVFAEDGLRVTRIEVDQDADQRAERVFEYGGGRLTSEARDTDGDDVLDRFERFGPDGRVELREEDLDGDGEIDVRSHYTDGRLSRKEILDPGLLEELAP